MRERGEDPLRGMARSEIVAARAMRLQNFGRDKNLATIIKRDALGWACQSKVPSPSHRRRFRNLDSSIPMMEAAKDRTRNNVSDPLDQSRTGRVLAK